MAACAVEKKDAEVVVCFRIGARAGSGLAQSESELLAPLARTIGRASLRPVTAVGPGVDGLWL